MLLFFWALLLTTTTLHIKVEPNLRFATPDDTCDKERAELTYALMDEFKDEATVVLPGGWLKMSCNSTKVDFTIFGKKGTLRSQVERVRTTLMVQVDSASINLYFKCKCNNNRYPSSDLASWRYIVCSPEQYKNSGSECQLENVCLVKSSTDPGSCQNLIEEDCKMGVERTAGMEYTTVCLGNSTKKYRSECEAGAKAGANDGWPMVETTTKGDCNNEELRNFWEGNFSLRHNIAVKGSLTLRPRNQKTTRVCQNGIMTCHLKWIGDQEPNNVTGSCSTGWTVTTNMIENCKKTKLYCIYQQKQPDQKFRWQFYLYSANVDVTFNGTKAQCEWPKWTGLGKTNPDAESKKCQQEFYFPYPVNPEGRKLELRYNTSITDIPTTTTQTTTTPTTTETTESTTQTTTTPTTTETTESTTESTTQTTTSPSTTESTTTTTHVPHIANITLNTTANISHQTTPRSKSWSTKEDVFILVVGQFLLFLLPSFMLYKEESLYIKE